VGVRGTAGCGVGAIASEEDQGNTRLFSRQVGATTDTYFEPINRSSAPAFAGP
jgi:hypothetical protein